MNMYFNFNVAIEWYDWVLIGIAISFFLALYIRSIIRSIIFHYKLKKYSIEKLELFLIGGIGTEHLDFSIRFFMQYVDNTLAADPVEPYKSYIYKSAFLNTLFEHKDKLGKGNRRFDNDKISEIIQTLVNKKNVKYPDSVYMTPPLFNFNMKVEDKRYHERYPTSEYFYTRDLTYLEKRTQLIEKEFGFCFDDLRCYVRQITKQAFDDDSRIIKNHFIDTKMIEGIDKVMQDKIKDFILTNCHSCGVELYDYEDKLYSTNFYELEIQMSKMIETALTSRTKTDKISNDRAKSLENEVFKRLSNYGKPYQNCYLYDSDLEIDCLFCSENHILVIECKANKYSKEFEDDRQKVKRQLRKAMRQLSSRIQLMTEKGYLTIRNEINGEPFRISDTVRRKRILPLIITEEDTYDFSSPELSEMVAKNERMPVTFSIDDFITILSLHNDISLSMEFIENYCFIKSKFNMSNDHIMNLIDIMSHKTDLNLDFSRNKRLHKTMFMVQLKKRFFGVNCDRNSDVIKFSELLMQYDKHLYKHVNEYLRYSAKMESVYDKRIFTEIGEVIIIDSSRTSILDYVFEVSSNDILVGYDSNTKEIKFLPCAYKQFRMGEFDH